MSKTLLKAPVSIYIHIPFCVRRCSYCDFISYAGVERFHIQYIDALCSEIRYTADKLHKNVNAHTIYFGGGTPSILPLDSIILILTEINKNFNFQSSPEISIEANPGTVSFSQLSSFYTNGINRISLGMQSSHPDDLRLLHRIHRYADVINAVKWARKAGFSNINLDLMFGLPGQSMERWKTTLAHAVNLNPPHLSVYSLLIEENTPMATWVEKGLISSPDDDLAADMYEYAQEFLKAEGYHQYEISNWAKDDGKSLDKINPSFACRHNLQYWHNEPYLGFGVGAHGYIPPYRYANTHSIPDYIHKWNSTLNHNIWPDTDEILTIDPSSEKEETMMVGLRLTGEGVSRTQYFERFGNYPEDDFSVEINRLVKQNLLEYAGSDLDRLRLTRRGILVGNQVFMQFIDRLSPTTF